MEIIPSLLVKSESEFKKQLAGLKNSCKLVQLDICDGKFVPNTTWADPKVIKNQKQNFELHLMVQNPEKELIRWQNVRNIKRIIIHIETLNNNFRISKFQNFKISLALNPDTPLSKLKPHLKNISGVLFMSVHPGKQGQKILPKTLTKIKNFKKQYPKIFTEIDGGVNLNTLPKIIKSGVDAINPGSAIFHNKRTPEQNVKEMKKLIKQFKK